MNVIPGNVENDFDAATLAKLGRYVYALRDPRDRKVFYIGKAGGVVGQGNDRVFDHFYEARRSLLNPGADASSKVRRIIEIWAVGESVEWFIVRHGLSPSEEATVLHVEAALIDLLDISQNGPSLNIQRGHHVAEHGLLSSGDVRAVATHPVMPINAQWLNRPIFIFPVQNTVDRGFDAFTATRGDWVVAPTFRERNDALAVGVVRGISAGAYRVRTWEPANGLWRFDGESLGDCELHEKNYLGVIARAMGYWMRGNYLVIEFLPDQQFRFLRGSSVREVQSL